MYLLTKSNKMIVRLCIVLLFVSFRCFSQPIAYKNALILSTDSQTIAQLSSRKMLEIVKYVDLNSAQNSELYSNAFNHQSKLDSALLYTSSKYEYAKIKYSADSLFDSQLFSLLTDSQIVVYIKAKGVIDVEMKTKEKIHYLEESGEYKDEELMVMSQQIFDYLMKEKVVYLRDKYDIDKQKRNIQALKNIQPVCLKEAETRRKLKNKGLTDNGVILWRIQNEKNN